MFRINANGLTIITSTVMMAVFGTPIASACWLLYRAWALLP